MMDNPRGTSAFAKWLYHRWPLTRASYWHFLVGGLTDLYLGLTAIFMAGSFWFASFDVVRRLVPIQVLGAVLTVVGLVRVTGVFSNHVLTVRLASVGTAAVWSFFGLAWAASWLLHGNASPWTIGIPLGYAVRELFGAIVPIRNRGPIDG